MACVVVVGVISANTLFPGELSLDKYLYLNLGTLMLWFAVASITFFAACIFDDSKYYYFVGAGVPVLFFFFNMMGNMGEDLEFLNVVFL